MTQPERPVGTQRRIPAGTFESADGPNYALPGVPRLSPPPPPRIPPPLLFGVLLALLVGAGGFLLVSSRPTPEDELTAEELTTLLREQEQTTRAPAVAVAEPRSGSAVLEVETLPAGATVSLDEAFAGRTPLRRDRLAAQWYVVSVRKDGYQPVDTLVHLDPEGVARLALSLTPSSPDDRPAGTEFASGGASLARGDAASSEAVTRPASPIRILPTPQAQPAQPTPTPERAAPPPPREPVVREATVGSLQVNSEPAGVPVTLDGRSVGTTPLRLGSVAVGRHTVALTAPGGETRSFQVNIEAGQRNVVEATLPVAAAPRSGTLSIVVKPWGSIYVDGTLRARDTDLRYEVELPAGTHRVRVEHPTLGTWERKVEIVPGRPTALTADLSY